MIVKTGLVVAETIRNTMRVCFGPLETRAAIEAWSAGAGSAGAYLPERFRGARWAMAIHDGPIALLAAAYRDVSDAADAAMEMADTHAPAPRGCEVEVAITPGGYRRVSIVWSTSVRVCLSVEYRQEPEIVVEIEGEHYQRASAVLLTALTALGRPTDVIPCMREEESVLEWYSRAARSINGAAKSAEDGR